MLRYGAYSDEVLTRLRMMRDDLAPVARRGPRRPRPVDLRLLMAQALQMGDEGHNRNRAATSLLLRELAPAIVRTAPDAETAARALEFIHRNDHFFLNLSMPMAKCMLLAAEGEPLSSMVTVMARNGTDFGIQISALPGRWFVGPAEMVRGLYFPGFTAADANPDIGDSAITETAGIGGFAMAAAPAIVQFVGGSAEDALATTRAMGRITIVAQPGVRHPRPLLRRHAHRHRHPPGRGAEPAADDQHRHRPPRRPASARWAPDLSTRRGVASMTPWPRSLNTARRTPRAGRLSRHQKEEPPCVPSTSRSPSASAPRPGRPTSRCR